MHNASTRRLAKQGQMTMMIYRGIAHDGSRQQPTHAPKNLIYRGVRHDGLWAVAQGRNDLRLRYRGHWHDGAGAVAPVQAGHGIATPAFAA
jgi:hypothetical protein